MSSDADRRVESLEECLAECLAWIKSQDIYDDQLAEETAWIPRLKQVANADGLAPLAAVYDGAFVRVEELPAVLEELRTTVQRADAQFGPGEYEAALGRARLRPRLRPAPEY